jgi:hypothetical protein
VIRIPIARRQLAMPTPRPIFVPLERPSDVGSPVEMVGVLDEPELVEVADVEPEPVVADAEPELVEVGDELECVVLSSKIQPFI